MIVAVASRVAGHVVRRHVRVVTAQQDAAFFGESTHEDLKELAARAGANAIINLRLCPDVSNFRWTWWPRNTVWYGDAVVLEKCKE